MTDIAKILPFAVPRPSAEQLATFARERAAEHAREEHDRMTRRLALLRAMDAPRRIIDALPRASRDTEPMRALADIGHTRVVVLAGGVGTGKSTAALVWLMRAPERHRVWYATARGLASTAPWTREWQGAHAAVLDDLGTEDCDHRFTGRFDELVAYFHGQVRGLVITTNLTGAALRDRYGERVASRINESRGFLPVVGPDLRIRGRE